MKQYFITGTDTEVGKTFISQTILQVLKQHRKIGVGFKPIASGSEMTVDGLRNEDALHLLEASAMPLHYSDVNIYTFEPAIAPHIAAKRSQVELSLDKISQGLHKLQQKQPDVLLIEGAGGWRLPLTLEPEPVFFSEFAITHQLPVVLVVGMRLGCLNHARMTVEAIQQDGLTLAGWVANHVDDEMHCRSDNLQSLHSLIPAPFLGEVPMTSSPTVAAEYLNIAPLIQGL